MKRPLGNSDFFNELRVGKAEKVKLVKQTRMMTGLVRSLYIAVSLGNTNTDFFFFSKIYLFYEMVKTRVFK